MLDAEEVVVLKTGARERFEIPIFDDQASQVGKLSLIIRGDEENPVLVDLLTEWRHKYMKFFLTQFTASSRRTADWLRSVVIPSPDRLLFFIRDSSDSVIGNFGISNIKIDSCELDNLIRGEKGGHPRLIYFCEIALLRWIFSFHSTKVVNLHVFSNNVPTIRLHTNVGFREVKRYSLTKNIQENGDIILSPDSNKPGVAVEFTYVQMSMTRSIFNHRYMQ